jgi:uncharacterized membrane protein HdeD (DUF308 family)
MARRDIDDSPLAIAREEVANDDCTTGCAAAARPAKKPPADRTVGRTSPHTTELDMDESNVVSQLGPRWGWIALRGVAAISFGVLAFLLPGLTLAVLVVLWGAYVLVDGVLALAAAFRLRDGGRRMWSLLAVGLLGIVVGVLTFVWPGITALALLLLIAAWAIATGVLEIVAAVRLRKEIDNEWLLVVSGIASVVFGVLLVIWPASGALALVWLIASFALLLGVLLIALAFRLRGLAHHGAGPAAA